MSKITPENIIAKCRASATNAEKRGFNPELYRAAADEIEYLQRHVRALETLRATVPDASDAEGFDAQSLNSNRCTCGPCWAGGHRNKPPCPVHQ